MSQYSSGFPIDPDPERTAYLPPVPEAPQPGYLPPAPEAPQPGYLPPVPPAAWTPAPAPLDQTAILPPIPAQADPYATAAQPAGGIPGWDAPAMPPAGAVEAPPVGGFAAPVDPLTGGQPAGGFAAAAGAGVLGQVGGFAAPASPGVADPLTGAQHPGAGGIPGWDAPAMPPAGAVEAPPVGGFAAPVDPLTGGQPAGGFAAPASAGLLGQAAHAPQVGVDGGIPGWDAPAVPVAEAGAGALTGGQLLGAPGESIAEVSFVGADGWADAPVTYGEPASLRERFANAAPTGPGGQPAVRPLEAGPEGSLREAFAAAAPTGAPAATAAPAAAVPPLTAPSARRTGSPIIDPGVQPAALTAVLAVLLALGSLLGRPGLLVPVVALQAVTAAGWFRLNGMWPARQGIALAFLGGLVADAALLAGAGTGGAAGQAIAGTLGAFFLLVLILQIFRPSNPAERFAALTVSASATVVTVLAAGFLAAPAHADVVPAALGAAVAAGVSAVLRSPVKLGFVAGGFAAAVVGAIVGVLGSVGAGGGLFLGLAAGLCGLLGRRVAAFDWPSRFVHMTAGVALPLALAGPAVYLVGLLLAK